MAGADRDGRVAEGDLQVGVADRAAVAAVAAGRGAGVRRAVVGVGVGGGVGWQGRESAKSIDHEQLERAAGVASVMS